MLATNPFNSKWQNNMDWFLHVLMDVFLWCFSEFIGCFMLTTLEIDEGVRLNYLVVSPIYFLLSLFTLPIFLFCFLLWCILQPFRLHPYRYSVNSNAMNEGIVKESPKQQHSHIKHKIYGAASVNLCLLPEVLLRFNNQRNCMDKASKIGKSIAKSQHLVSKENNSARENSNFTNFCKDSNIQYEYAQDFPNDMDFVCCQEAWTLRNTEVMIEKLHQYYPYVVYDTGYHSMTSSYYLFNSGQLIASKYPIIDFRFHWFPAYWLKSKSPDATNKGFLIVKVDLGKDDEGMTHIGFLSTTHLQAYKGSNQEVHFEQLTDILKWSQQFLTESKRDHEVIDFDVMCGDWNFDNLSPVDANLAYHEVFKIYYDPCVQSPGKDYPWTVGTEFRQGSLYSPETSTPEALAYTLSDPLLRRTHIIDGLMESCDLEMAFKEPPKNELHEHGGRRRIDRIFLNKAFPTQVTHYYFVTALATLTDHIPVAISFTVH